MYLIGNYMFCGDLCVWPVFDAHSDIFKFFRVRLKILADGSEKREDDYIFQIFKGLCNIIKILRKISMYSAKSAIFEPKGG